MGLFQGNGKHDLKLSITHNVFCSGQQQEEAL